MKKNLIFLLTAVTGLGFSSCEKEVVKEIYSDSQGAATLNFDTRFGDQEPGQTKEKRPHKIQETDKGRVTPRE